MEIRVRNKKINQMFDKKDVQVEVRFEDMPRLLGEIYDILSELKGGVNPGAGNSPDKDSWLNLTEFCNYHPGKPAKSTVYQWISKGLVPVNKRGKRLYFLKSQVDEWLIGGRCRDHIQADPSISELMWQPKSRR